MRWLCLLVMIPAMLSATSALAYGPGMHIREADTALELLRQQDPTWDQLAQVPLAIRYMHLGTLAPDFQWMSDHINFGHSKELSYHLLDRAEELDNPLYRMFALGHLTHSGGGDPSSEQFLAPILWVLAPIGMLDILDDGDGPKGESEFVTEVFGDVVIGDFDAVVGMLYTFWLESDQAGERMAEIVHWYCTEGADFHNKNIDCDAVVQEFADRLASAEDFLAGMNEEQAKAMMAVLLDQPLQDVADLVYGGLLGGILGYDVDLGARSDEEMARFKSSILMDRDYWESTYEAMAEVGPSISLYFLESRVPDSTWPVYTDKPMIWGNIRSVMNFLPQDFAAAPPLLLDGLTWFRADGSEVTSISPEVQGEEMSVRVRLYACMPFLGTIRGVVRKDMPGLGNEQDQILGQATLELDVDPRDYGARPRELLDIPFTVDGEGAMGFYLELYQDEEPLPWATTSWDRMWSIQELPMNWKGYYQNFGTYYRWPPSLRLNPPNGEQTLLMVQALVAPAGGPALDGVLVTAGESQVVGSPSGLSVFGELPPGDVAISGTREGYQDSAENLVSLSTGSISLVALLLHAIPQLDKPGDYVSSSECVSFTWAGERFKGQASSFVLDLVRDSDGEVVATSEQAGDQVQGSVCPPAGVLEDGSLAHGRIHGVYQDGTPGVEAGCDPFVVDGSAPELTETTLLNEAGVALCEGAQVPRIRVVARDPHSSIAALSWRYIGGEEWTRVPAPEGFAGDELDLEFSVTQPPEPAWELLLKAENRAGLESDEVHVVFDLPLDCGLLPDSEPRVEPEPEVVDQPLDLLSSDTVIPGEEVMTRTDTLDEVRGTEESGAAGSGSCSASASSVGSGPRLALTALLFLALAVLRRRSGSTP